MNSASEKRLLKLHPALATAVRAAVADLSGRGLTVEVVQGLRTFEEQDALYAQGRTKPGAIVTQAKGGESNHNYGLAVDLCPFVDGKPDWNAPMDVWSAIGAAAGAQGLDWGGRWVKFIDKPHVELKALTLSQCQAVHKTGGLPAVWAAASECLEKGTTRGWLDDAPRGPVRARRKTRASAKRKTRAVKRRRKTAKSPARKKRAAPAKRTGRGRRQGRRRSRS